MRRALFLLIICFCCSCTKVSAQIDLKKLDLDNLDLNDIIGKVMHVKRGFAPKFALGNIPIPEIPKVGEILGLKKNLQINKLFNTFKAGRTVYKIASYAGSAAAVYGIAKQISDSSTVPGGKAALTTGLVTIGTGLIVKFLTKAASYKAVDIFNGIAVRKIKDIFSIKSASGTIGVGLYVKLD
jgi:hypothetical protein